MAVSHVFSNAVADAAGTLTIWFGATTATVAASDVVKPSDWNSAHNQLSTIGGNTAGQSTVSGTNIVLAGGNNITLSANGQTISVHGAVGGGAGFSGGVSTGGNTVGSTGITGTQLVFAGGNNITLSQSTGANGGTITISGPNTVAQTNVAFSADASSTFQTLSFQNSNGVSFSNNAGAIRVTHGLQFTSNTSNITSNALNTSVSRVINIVAATNNTGGGTGSLSSNVSLSNANGMTFYTSAGNAVVGSYTVPVVTDYFSRTNTTFNGANISGSITLNTNGLQLSMSVAAPGGGGMTAGVSTGGNTLGQTGTQTGQLIFAGGNNITLSVATAVGGNQTITISGPNAGGAQTGISGIIAGAQTQTVGTVSFANSNGISFGMSNSSIITASYTVPTQSVQTVGGYFVGNTTGQSSSSTVDARSISFDGAGIVSAGWSNGTIRISATQSNQAFSADASSTFQTLSLQNSNGISFSNNAGAIRLTHDLAFSTQLNNTGRIYVTAQSTGQSSSSTYDLRTLSIVPDGIISAGWSGGSFRISATQSNQAFSAGAASSTFQTISFQDSNGLSFSNNAGAIRVSYTRNVASNAIQSVGSVTGSGTNTSRFAPDDHVHAGVFSMGVSTGGNTIGDTRVDVGRFVLQGGNNITLSQITAANALNTIVVSAGAVGGGNFSGGVSNLGNTAGSTGVTGTRLVFVGSQNVTLSQSTDANGGTISFSAAAGGGGGYSAGISTQGNTAGTTGFASASLQLVGSNLITLSQSTSNNGAHTITVVGPSRPAIQIFANLAIGFGGSASAAMTHGSMSNGTAMVFPLHGNNDVFPGNMTVDRLGILYSFSHTNTSSTTQANTSTYAFGIYTLNNATQLSRLYSGTMTANMTANSGNSSLFNGLRWVTINSNNWDTQPNLSNTMYWGVMFALSSGVQVATASHGPMVIRVGATAAVSGIVQAASASGNSRANGYPFHGYVSVSTSGLPASIALSNMIHTGSAYGQMVPHVVMLGSNATGIMGAW